MAYLHNQFTRQLFTLANNRLGDMIDRKWARHTPLGRWCSGGFDGFSDWRLIPVAIAQIGRSTSGETLGGGPTVCNNADERQWLWKVSMNWFLAKLYHYFLAKVAAYYDCTRFRFILIDKGNQFDAKVFLVVAQVSRQRLERWSRAIVALFRQEYFRLFFGQGELLGW